MKRMGKRRRKPTLTDTFQLRTALYLACLQMCGGDMDAACEAAEYYYDNAPELVEKMREMHLPDEEQRKPQEIAGKLLKFRRKPNLERKELAECLSLFAQGVDNGCLHSIFAVAITDKGALPVVLVEPEDREVLIAAMNVELSRMLESPHHVISDVTLDEFLRQHNITAMDVLRFRATKSSVCCLSSAVNLAWTSDL